jgi:hypothetical protein
LVFWFNLMLPILLISVLDEIYAFIVFNLVCFSGVKFEDIKTLVKCYKCLGCPRPSAL